MISCRISIKKNQEKYFFFKSFNLFNINEIIYVLQVNKVSKLQVKLFFNLMYFYLFDDGHVHGIVVS